MSTNPAASVTEALLEDYILTPGIYHGQPAPSHTALHLLIPQHPDMRPLTQAMETDIQRPKTTHWCTSGMTRTVSPPSSRRGHSIFGRGLVTLSTQLHGDQRQRAQDQRCPTITEGGATVEVLPRVEPCQGQICRLGAAVCCSAVQGRCRCSATL